MFRRKKKDEPTDAPQAPEVAPETASETAAAEPEAVETHAAEREGGWVWRVVRRVLNPKYRRYVRRTSKFMAHDDLGATIGDRVRIVETRPLSAKKRWRVVEIVQKAAK